MISEKRFKPGDVVKNNKHELYFIIYSNTDATYCLYVLKAETGLQYKENTKITHASLYIDVCFNKI